MRFSIFAGALLIAKAINPALAFTGGAAHISIGWLIVAAAICLWFDFQEIAR